MPNQTAKSTPAKPQAIQKCHELIVWLVPKLDAMPRVRKFTLGDKLETTALSVLEYLVKASYSKRKADALSYASQKLDLLKHLWRLALELNAISMPAYQAGGRLMVSLGQQLGGWQKQQA